MTDAQRWLAGALAPLLPRFPGLATSIRAAMALPLQLTDLVGVELRLDPVAAPEPAALHVQVIPETTDLLRSDEMAAWWPRSEQALPALLADLVDGGSLGREHGFVLDDVGGGRVAPAALYAGCGGMDAGTVVRVLAALGAPATTLDLLAAHPALARASHVGVMTARPQRPVRLVLSARDVSDDLWTTLAALDAAEPATLRLARELLEPVSGTTEGHLDVDLVGGRAGPVIGVERKHPDRAALGSDAALLHAWQGVRFTAADGSGAAPADVAAALAGAPLHRETRAVNHVKTVIDRGQVREQKVYLALHRRAAVRTAGTSGPAATGEEARGEGQTGTDA